MDFSHGHLFIHMLPFSFVALRDHLACLWQSLFSILFMFPEPLSTMQQISPYLSLIHYSTTSGKASLSCRISLLWSFQHQEVLWWSVKWAIMQVRGVLKRLLFQTQLNFPRLQNVLLATQLKSQKHNTQKRMLFVTQNQKKMNAASISFFQNKSNLCLH